MTARLCQIALHCPSANKRLQDSVLRWFPGQTIGLTSNVDKRPPQQANFAKAVFYLNTP